MYVAQRHICVLRYLHIEIFTYLNYEHMIYTDRCILLTRHSPYRDGHPLDLEFVDTSITYTRSGVYDYLTKYFLYLKRPSDSKYSIQHAYSLLLSALKNIADLLLFSIHTVHLLVIRYHKKYTNRE